VCNDFGAEWGEWGSIEVEVPEQGGVGGERRVNSRGAQKIEGQRSLREKTIPFGHGEIGVNSAEDGDKMIFECPDGPFGGVDSMFFWRDPLEWNPVFLEGIFEIL
jgi:hypothetical protein